MSNTSNNKNILSTRHQLSLHNSVRELVAKINRGVLPERQITFAAALSVANREVVKNANAPVDARIYAAQRAVAAFGSLATKNKVTTAALENSDLLAIGHPMSTKQHAMSENSLRHARALWVAADSSIVSPAMRALVATAHALEPGSIEREHAFARLFAVGPAVVPITAAVDLEPMVAAFGLGLGGNSRAARSARARMQRRDRRGRFAFMGGGWSFSVKFADGKHRGISGKTIGASGVDDIDVDVRGSKYLRDGVYTVPAKQGIAAKAIVPSRLLKNLPEKEVSAEQQKYSIDASTLVRKNAPTGWTQVSSEGARQSSPRASWLRYKSADGYVLEVPEHEENSGEPDFNTASKPGELAGEPGGTLYRAVGNTVVAGKLTSWDQVEKQALRDQDDYQKYLDSDEGQEALKSGKYDVDVTEEDVPTLQPKGERPAQSTDVVPLKSVNLNWQTEDGPVTREGLKEWAKEYAPGVRADLLDDGTVKLTGSETNLRNAIDKATDGDYNATDYIMDSAEIEARGEPTAPVLVDTGASKSPKPVDSESAGLDIQKMEKAVSGFYDTTYGPGGYEMVNNADSSDFIYVSGEGDEYNDALGDGYRPTGKRVGGERTTSRRYAKPSGNTVDLDPDPSKVLDSLIAARKNGDLVRFNYKGVPRVAQPGTSYLNPKNNQRNIRMFDHNIGEERTFAVKDIKPSTPKQPKAETTKPPTTSVSGQAVDIPSTDVAEIAKVLNDAIASKSPVRFDYSGKTREFVPERIYTNPKTSKQNAVGFSKTDNEGRTFTLDKMSPPPPVGGPSVEPATTEVAPEPQSFVPRQPLPRAFRPGFRDSYVDPNTGKTVKIPKELLEEPWAAGESADLDWWNQAISSVNKNPMSLDDREIVINGRKIDKDDVIDPGFKAPLPEGLPREIPKDTTPRDIQKIIDQVTPKKPDDGIVLYSQAIDGAINDLVEKSLIEPGAPVNRLSETDSVAQLERLIKKAILGKEDIAFTYHDKPRIVTPAEVVTNKIGKLQVKGFSRTDGEDRTFNIDKINKPSADAPVRVDDITNMPQAELDEYVDSLWPSSDAAAPVEPTQTQSSWPLDTLVPKESSAVARIDYDEDANEMLVAFKVKDGKGGGIYLYPEVSKDDYRGIASASSVGSAIGKFIKGRKFEKMNGAQASKWLASKFPVKPIPTINGYPNDDYLGEEPLVVRYLPPTRPQVTDADTWTNNKLDRFYDADGNINSVGRDYNKERALTIGAPGPIPTINGYLIDEYLGEEPLVVRYLPPTRPEIVGTRKSSKYYEDKLDRFYDADGNINSVGRDYNKERALTIGAPGPIATIDGNAIDDYLGEEPSVVRYLPPTRPAIKNTDKYFEGRLDRFYDADGNLNKDGEDYNAARALTMLAGEPNDRYELVTLDGERGFSYGVANKIFTNNESKFVAVRRDSYGWDPVGTFDRLSQAKRAIEEREDTLASEPGPFARTFPEEGDRYELVKLSNEGGYSYGMLNKIVDKGSAFEAFRRDTYGWRSLGEFDTMKLAKEEITDLEDKIARRNTDPALESNEGTLEERMAANIERLTETQNELDRQGAELDEQIETMKRVLEGPDSPATSDPNEGTLHERAQANLERLVSSRNSTNESLESVKNTLEQLTGDQGEPPAGAPDEPDEPPAGEGPGSPERDEFLRNTSGYNIGNIDGDEYEDLIRNIDDNDSFDRDEKRAIVNAFEERQDKMDAAKEIEDSDDRDEAMENIANDYFAKIADVLGYDDEEIARVFGGTTEGPGEPPAGAPDEPDEPPAGTPAPLDDSDKAVDISNILDTYTKMPKTSYDEKTKAANYLKYEFYKLQKNNQRAKFMYKGKERDVEITVDAQYNSKYDRGEGNAKLVGFDRNSGGERSFFYKQIEPLSPSVVVPDDSYKEAFDSMFVAPNGTYKPNIFDVYEPVGRTVEQSDDYTDDPDVLATKYDTVELAAAASRGIADGSGDAPLDFEAGPEDVPVEAVLEALEKLGIDKESLLAKLYERIAAESNNKAMIDATKKASDDIDRSVLTDPDSSEAEKMSIGEAAKLNGRLGAPGFTDNAFNLISSHNETNPNILSLARDIENEPERTRAAGSAEIISRYLPWAFSNDPLERDAFRAYWGLILLSDGGDGDYWFTSDYEDNFMRNLAKTLGELSDGDVNDGGEILERLIDEYGGFKRFAVGRQRISQGIDDLSSPTPAAGLYRLTSVMATPSDKELQRYIFVDEGTDAFEKYTTIGSEVIFDPRSFSSLDVLSEKPNEAFGTFDGKRRKLIFRVPPGEIDAFDIHNYSWLPGEQEHIGYGPLKIEKVEKVGKLTYAIDVSRAGKPSDILPEEPAATSGLPTVKDYGDISSWTRVGRQLGSNSGGTFRDEDGNEYYVKTARSTSHAENEALASAFYKFFNIPASEVGLGVQDNDEVIITPMIPSTTGILQNYIGDAEIIAQLHDGFAIDAWLSNYDVAGLEFDNVVVDSNGNAYRIDPGGALMWRAQGKRKDWFGPEVNELDTMRNSDMNFSSNALFGEMSTQQVIDSGRKLLDITPSQIDEIVDSAISNPRDKELLKDILKRRRSSILAQLGIAEPGSEAIDAIPSGPSPSNYVAPVGFEAQDLQPGDVAASDSFVIERIFRDGDTPSGKVSVQGYFPGHESQRKEWNEKTTIEVSRGGGIPPKGAKPALHRPKAPRKPSPGAFNGKMAELLKDAKTWEEAAAIIRRTPMVFFDYESTGLPGPEKGGKNEPVQIGAVKVVDGKVVDRFSSYMNPDHELSDWSADNLKQLDGSPVTDDWLKTQISKREAHEAFLEFVGDGPVILGGQYTPFDLEILGRTLDQLGLSIDIAGTIDSKDLASGTLPKWNSKTKFGPNQVSPKDGKTRSSNSLGPIAEFLQVQLPDWHRADADAEAAWEITDAMLTRAIDTPDTPKTLLNIDDSYAETQRKLDEYDKEYKKYEEELAEYVAAKAIAAAWNCGGSGITAAVGPENGPCSVPDIETIIREATPAPIGEIDPDGVTGGSTTNETSMSDALEIDDPKHDGVDTNNPYKDEAFMPTEEQRDIIDAIMRGDDVVVEALAGTGKTSTLLIAGKRKNKEKPTERGVYIAFNKSAQLEAEKKFGDAGLTNIEVVTNDAISYRWAPQEIKNKMKRLKKNSPLAYYKNFAKEFGITEMEGKTLYEAVNLFKSAVNQYMISADDELGPQHFTAAGFEGDVPDWMLNIANNIWSDYTSPDGKAKINNTVVTKMWALSRPDLSKLGSGLKSTKDFIFFDEAQDINPVSGKVIIDQTAQTVYVGDENQAIYGFRGGENQLAKVDKTVVRLPLTKSFRFGKNIAAEGNKWLQLLGSPLRIEGAGATDGNIVAPGSLLATADAILVRTNSGGFGAIFDQLGRGRAVGVTKNYRDDLVKLTDSAEYLITGENRPSEMHEEMAPFKNWAEVEKAIADEDIQNKKVKKFAELVDEVGIDGLRDLIDKLKLVRGTGNVADTSEEAGEIGDVSPGSTGDVGMGIIYTVTDTGVSLSGNTYTNRDAIKATKRFSYNGTTKTWDAKTKGEEDTFDLLNGLSTSISGDSGSTKKAAGPIDVMITTVHQAKGLEWPSVAMWTDFFTPKVDKETGELVLPDPTEQKIAYVAVTRAMENLDLGGLDWINSVIPPSAQDDDVTPFDELPTSAPLEAPATTPTPAETPAEAPQAPESDDFSDYANERIVLSIPITIKERFDDALEDYADLDSVNEKKVKSFRKKVSGAIDAYKVGQYVDAEEMLREAAELLDGTPLEEPLKSFLLQAADAADAVRASKAKSAAPKTPEAPVTPAAPAAEKKLDPEWRPSDMAPPRGATPSGTPAAPDDLLPAEDAPKTAEQEAIEKNKAFRSNANKSADLQQKFNDLAEAVDLITGEDGSLKAMNRKRVREAMEKVSETRKKLDDKSISEQDALNELQQILDGFPEVVSNSAESIDVNFFRDMIQGVLDVLNGQYYWRPTGKNLPPLDAVDPLGRPVGYSRDGNTFLVPGMRVRDKWGFSGTVESYNENDWINVYIRYDIDWRDPAKVKKGSWGPGVGRRSMNPSTLTVLTPETDNDPWIDLPTTPETKKPAAAYVEKQKKDWAKLKAAREYEAAARAAELRGEEAPPMPPGLALMTPSADLVRESKKTKANISSYFNDSYDDKDVADSTNDFSLSKNNKIVASDAVITTTDDAGNPLVLMISREYGPFTGARALPGGFKDEGESFEAAADREMMEEVGISADQATSRTYLGEVNANDWDPRAYKGAQVAAVAYQVPPGTPLKVGEEATGADWVSIQDIIKGTVPIAFGHATWLAEAFKGTKYEAPLRALVRASKERNARLISQINAIRIERGLPTFDTPSPELWTPIYPDGDGGSGGDLPKADAPEGAPEATEEEEEEPAELDTSPEIADLDRWNSAKPEKDVGKFLQKVEDALQGNDNSQYAKFMDKHMYSISDDDKYNVDAAIYYVGGGSEEINAYLSGIESAMENDGTGYAGDTERMDQAIRTLDKIITLMPKIKKDTVVYRGVSRRREDDPIINALGNLKPGDTFSNASYTSTAFAKEVAETFVGDDDDGYLLEIVLPKGTRGIFVDAMSARGAEDSTAYDGIGTDDSDVETELILPRDSTFQVLSRDGKNIKLLLVPQSKAADKKIDNSQENIATLGNNIATPDLRIKGRGAAPDHTPPDEEIVEMFLDGLTNPASEFVTRWSENTRQFKKGDDPEAEDIANKLNAGMTLNEYDQLATNDPFLQNLYGGVVIFTTTFADFQLTTSQNIGDWDAGYMEDWKLNSPAIHVESLGGRAFWTDMAKYLYSPELLATAELTPAVAFLRTVRAAKTVDQPLARFLKFDATRIDTPDHPFYGLAEVGQEIELRPSSWTAADNLAVLQMAYDASVFTSESPDEIIADDSDRDGHVVLRVEGVPALNLSLLSPMTGEKEYVVTNGKYVVSNVKKTFTNVQEDLNLFYTEISLKLIASKEETADSESATPAKADTAAAGKFIKNAEFADVFAKYYTTAKQAFTNGDLTEKDWKRIQSYFGSDSVAVNTFLRSGKQLWLADGKDTFEKVIKSIDKIFAVAGVELPRDVVVFRGVFNADKVFPNGVQPGDIIDDPGYSSTSIKSDVARTFTNSDKKATVLAITVPSGTKMLANNVAVQAGQSKKEKEILLPRGLKYEVTSITERTRPNKTYPFLPEKYKEIAVKLISSSEDKKVAPEQLEVTETLDAQDSEVQQAAKYSIDSFDALDARTLPNALRQDAGITDPDVYFEHLDQLVKMYMTDKYDPTSIGAFKFALSEAAARGAANLTYSALPGTINNERFEVQRKIKFFKDQAEVLATTSDMLSWWRYAAEINQSIAGINRKPRATDDDNIRDIDEYYVDRSKKPLYMYKIIMDKANAGYDAAVAGRLLSNLETVSPTGRPAVQVEEPMPLTTSAFQGIMSLGDAISYVKSKKKDDRQLGAAALIDAADIEDLDVYVSVTEEDNKEFLQLKFKLTPWATLAQLNNVQESRVAGPYVWESRDPEIKKATRKDNSHVVIKEEALPGFSEGAEYVYEDVSNDTKISLISAQKKQGKIEIYNSTYDGAPAAFHGQVTIRLPIDATMSDVEKALSIAGVSNVRAATKEDARIVIENKLLSLFKQVNDPNVNEKSQYVRDTMLDEIASGWGVTPDDVVLVPGQYGRINYILPERTAKQIGQESGSGVLTHSFSFATLLNDEINKYIAQTSIGDLAQPFVAQDAVTKTFKSPNAGLTLAPELALINSVAEGVVSVIKYGLLSTVTRFGAGLQYSGLSNREDMYTGGADYVFFTPKPGDDISYNESPSHLVTAHAIFPSEKIFNRLDLYANGSDEFGRRVPGTNAIKQAKPYGYETVVKHGVSVTLPGVKLNIHPKVRDRVLEIFEEQGITEIDGIKLTDLMPGSSKFEVMPGKSSSEKAGVIIADEINNVGGNVDAVTFGEVMALLRLTGAPVTYPYMPSSSKVLMITRGMEAIVDEKDPTRVDVTSIKENANAETILYAMHPNGDLVQLRLGTVSAGSPIGTIIGQFSAKFVENVLLSLVSEKATKNIGKMTGKTFLTQNAIIPSFQSTFPEGSTAVSGDVLFPAGQKDAGLPKTEFQKDGKESQAPKTYDEYYSYLDEFIERYGYGPAIAQMSTKERYDHYLAAYDELLPLYISDIGSIVSSDGKSLRAAIIAALLAVRNRIVEQDDDAPILAAAAPSGLPPVDYDEFRLTGNYINVPSSGAVIEDVDGDRAGTLRDVRYLGITTTTSDGITPTGTYVEIETNRDGRGGYYLDKGTSVTIDPNTHEIQFSSSGIKYMIRARRPSDGKYSRERAQQDGTR